jgi:hypothetical protein
MAQRSDKVSRVVIVGRQRADPQATWSSLCLYFCTISQESADRRKIQQRGEHPGSVALFLFFLLQGCYIELSGVTLVLWDLDSELQIIRVEQLRSGELIPASSWSHLEMGSSH